MTHFSPEQLELDADEMIVDAPALSPARNQSHNTARPSARRTGTWRTIRTITPLLVADLVALSFSAFISWKLLAFVSPVAWHAIRIPALATLLALLPTYWIWGLYNGFGTHPVVEQRHIATAHFGVALAAICGAGFAPPFTLWNLALLVCGCVSVPFARAVARRLACHAGWWGYPTLLVAYPASIHPVSEMLLNNCGSGLRLAATTGGAESDAPPGIAALAGERAIDAFIAEHAIRHAVISIPDAGPAQLARLVARYEPLVPHLLILADGNLLPGLWGESRSCGRLTGMEIRNRSAFLALLAIKRAVDLIVAIIALPLLLPLMIVVAIAVRASSPGPIFFGHARIGRRGRRFQTWKFRTMYCDSDRLLSDYFRNDPAAHAAWVREHKLRCDPRVTPIGNILRKWSLDELPQLWNVLAGQMSLVGPRPIVDAEVPKYGPVFEQYKSVRPGITGLWQVSGRNDTIYSERVALDQYYIRNWSPWLDLYILPRTLFAIVHRKGAY